MRPFTAPLLKRSAPLAALSVAALLGGCAYNEALGRQQVLIVDDAQLAQAASSAWAQTTAGSRISSDPAANRRVRSVAQRIVDASGAGGQPWDIRVFADKSANAFVLPGNRMGVNTGLLSVVENDDQLAAVLGHEVAHTLARHAAERYSQTALAQLGLGVARGVAGDSTAGRAIAAYGGAGAQVGVLLPFSRRHELEADRIGVDLMAKAGFRPSQAVALWRNMAAQRTGGGSLRILSTHPSDETRIQQLETYVRSRGYS